jgi:hypothetical protein
VPRVIQTLNMPTVLTLYVKAVPRVIQTLNMPTVLTLYVKAVPRVIQRLKTLRVSSLCGNIGTNTNVYSNSASAPCIGNDTDTTTLCQQDRTFTFPNH